MLAFHSQYVHAPKAQASFFNTKKMTTLIVLGVLVPLLHPPLSCSTNLATYQTQRKIQDIAEALSYRVLFFSSPSISFQNHLTLLELHLLSYLRSIFSICCLSSTLSPKNLSSPSQTSDLSSQKVRCFFQKLLQNVQFRSNPIQDLPSCHLN